MSVTRFEECVALRGTPGRVPFRTPGSDAIVVMWMNNQNTPTFVSASMFPWKDFDFSRWSMLVFWKDKIHGGTSVSPSGPRVPPLTAMKDPI